MQPSRSGSFPGVIGTSVPLTGGIPGGVISWIQPRLERKVEPVEHCLLDAAGIGVLTPFRDVLVLARPLDLDDEFLDQHLLVRKRLAEMLLAQIGRFDLPVFRSEET